MKTHLVTKKIQLIIDNKDSAFIKNVYETLYNWRTICRKAANLLMTHYFVLEELKDILYLTDGVKLKLADAAKDTEGILNTSKMNSGYRMLKQHYSGAIPTPILSCLKQRTLSYFNEYKMDFLMGKRSLPNHREEIPIPFKGTDVKGIKQMEDGHNFSLSIFKIPFKTHLGRDIFDKRLLIEQWANGDRALKTSMLQLEGNKIFLLATFEIESKAAPPPDSSVVAALYMGTEHAILLHIGNKNYTIGTKDHFLHRRLAIQAAINRKYAAFGVCKSKTDKNRRNKATQHLKAKDKNFVHTCLHQYSAKVIDICLKHGVGTLLLCQDKEALAEDDNVLRYWNYYGLKEKLIYKSSMNGISIVEE